MGHSSRIFCCLSLLLVAPSLAEGRTIGLTRATAPAARIAPLASLHNAARAGARPSLAFRAGRPVVRPSAARLNTLASLQRVGLRNGRVPRLGNGFGLFGVGLGLSTAENLTDLPFPADTDGSAFDTNPAPLPRCVRPQIIKIGQGIRRKVKTRVLYGPSTGCAQY